MEREFVAQKVRNKLTASEAHAEQAVQRTAELLADLCAARVELGLAATAGDAEWPTSSGP